MTSIVFDTIFSPWTQFGKTAAHSIRELNKLGYNAMAAPWGQSENIPSDVPLWDRKKQPDIWIRISGADSFKMCRGKINIGMFLAETLEVSPYIVRCCNAMDAICVPSTFVRDICQSNGITAPTYLTPTGYDSDIIIPVHRSFPMGDNPFTFLNVGIEKNAGLLIEAFQEEFENESNVKLIVKSLPGYEHGKECIHSNKVEWISEVLSDRQLQVLYDSAHCFVFSTANEGFSMPMLDATASGLPVVAPRFGGYMDFCDIDSPLLFPIAGFQHRWVTRYNWPDSISYISKDELKAKMREAYHKYDEYAYAAYSKAVNEIQQKWTWKSVIMSMKVMIDDLQKK